MRRILVIAFAAALAGCGGGGDGRLSADEYRTQADSICSEANRKLNDLGDADTPAELRSLVKRAKPIAQEAVDDLEALEPPEELQAKVDDWNRQNEKLLGMFDELSEEENLVKLQAKAQEFSDLNDETNRYARTQLGLEDCAEG